VLRIGLVNATLNIMRKHAVFKQSRHSKRNTTV
jgi:hypothetical protein